MSARLAPLLLLALTACPPTRNLPPSLSTRTAPAAARFVRFDGEARRDGSNIDVVFRMDGTVVRGDVLVLRVSATDLLDARDRVLARFDERGALRLSGASQSTRLVESGVERADRHRALRRDDGRLTIVAPSGESVDAPWTLRCAPEAAATGVLALLLLDGLEAAQSSGDHQGSTP